MYRLLRFGVLLTLVSVGCSAAIETSEDKLKYAVTELNEGVRWGRVQDVLTHIDPASQEHFLDMHREFGSEIRITGYEVVSTKVNMDDKVADIGIKITWYRIDMMEVHDTVLMQRWEERDRLWLLTAESYQAGKPF